MRSPSPISSPCGISNRHRLSGHMLIPSLSPITADSCTTRAHRSRSVSCLRAGQRTKSITQNPFGRRACRIHACGYDPQSLRQARDLRRRCVHQHADRFGRAPGQRCRTSGRIGLDEQQRHRSPQRSGVRGLCRRDPEAPQHLHEEGGQHSTGCGGRSKEIFVRMCDLTMLHDMLTTIMKRAAGGRGQWRRWRDKRLGIGGIGSSGCFMERPTRFWPTG